MGASGSDVGSHHPCPTVEKSVCHTIGVVSASSGAGSWLGEAMRKLVVEKFSCIEKAEIDLSRLTVLIGPQASGKSVLSKLIFFFNDIMSSQYLWLEDGKPYSSFIAFLGDEFKTWFPPAAWGGYKFSIKYTSGPITFSIARKGLKSKLTDDVTITITESFQELYEHGLRVSRSERFRVAEGADPEVAVEREYETFWRIRDSLESALARMVGDDYVISQTFVPAGRSFFTSIGKTIVAFDQSGLLDPVTVKFGRLFTAYRDRWRSRTPSARHMTADERDRHRSAMKLFFGGEIRRERDKDFVETPDGRRIPFHILSSGQQELLPLWMVMSFMARKSSERRIVYIEEPEAHLFPTAQSRVVEYLTSLLSDSAPGRSMVITTHSPYVLSKLNNLLMAGTLGSSSKEKSLLVEAIVPKVAWIRPIHVRAYAISNGVVVSILDEDGLIDANYLDAVSDDIGLEFAKLLELGGYR